MSADCESRGQVGQLMLDRAARTWKTPHGFQNTDASGKTAGGGGEFAKQVMAWQTPAVDSFRSRGGDRKSEQGLDQQARLWSTITVPNGGRGPESKEQRRSRGGGGSNLYAEVQQWPTPVVGDHRSGVTGAIAKKNSRPLCEAVSLFPSLPGRPRSMGPAARAAPGC
jgi:hypothetical protein